MAIPKNKTIINIDDYTGFRWNGKHTSELGLTIVSSSSRYSLNPISSITNNTVDVPGGDGQYFFNSTYGPKKWTVTFSFDNLDDYQWRDLLDWLYHKDTSDLVFDELPYKAYNAKLEGTPVVSYLAFEETKAKQGDDSLDIQTLQTYDWGTYSIAAPSYITENADGTNNFDSMYYKKRIYKGEGTLNFVAFFPFAYSARDYNGKYMKYLDEIEYFPNIAETETLSPMEVGNATSLTSSSKSIYKLKSIEGVTKINDDKTVERGIIGETTEGRLILNKANKIWTYFQLAGQSNEDENEYVFFDQCGDTKDIITFVEDGNGKGKYQLIKKVGCVDLLEFEIVQEMIKTLTPSTDELTTLQLNLRSLPDILNDLKISEEEMKEPQTIILASNQVQYVSKPEKDTKVPFTIIGSSIKKNKLQNLQLEFNLTNQQINNFKQSIENRNSEEEISDLVTKSATQFLLFYPCQEKNIDIVEYTNTTEPLAQNVSAQNPVIISIKNKLASSSVDLTFNVTFDKIPVLYDNFNEWKDSSGLLPSKNTLTVNYDDCIKVEDTQATFGYKIYNGGDLATPFRLTYPVSNKPLKDSDEEITFVLVQKEDELQDEPVGNRRIDSIMELQKGVPYSKEDSEEYIYYFYQINDYSLNKITLLNVKTGDFEDFELKNNLYQRLSPKEKINALDSFTIRFNTGDSLNSYGELVKNYTIAAAREDGQYFTNKVEIDTYKQTINFISTTTIDNRETIIPIYFTLLHGNLFYIPPKVDNLYLLVYNNRDKKNSFINNDVKSNPEIEYRYLYL